MGGDGGHGSHGQKPPYVVPDWRIYKVEDVPELMACRRALAGHGLKDPWARNEVWKFPKISKVEMAKQLFGRGMKYGLAAAIITTAIGYMLPEDSHGHGGHDHSHAQPTKEC